MYLDCAELAGDAAASIRKALSSRVSPHAILTIVSFVFNWVQFAP